MIIINLNIRINLIFDGERFSIISFREIETIVSDEFHLERAVNLARQFFVVNNFFSVLKEIGPTHFLEHGYLGSHAGGVVGAVGPNYSDLQSIYLLSDARDGHFSLKGLLEWVRGL